MYLSFKRIFFTAEVSVVETHTCVFFFPLQSVLTKPFSGEDTYLCVFQSVLAG